MEISIKSIKTNKTAHGVLIALIICGALAACGTITSQPEPHETPFSVTSSPTVETTQAPTGTVESTYTPQPTLSPDVAYAHIMDLLDSNAGCKLPCWWGFAPGETAWSLARNELEAFVTSIEQGGTDYIFDDGVRHYVTNFTVEFEYDGNTTGGRSIYSLRNGIISMIGADPPITVRSYQLYQLISTYGKPEEVFLAVFTSTAYGGTPFYLVIFYPEKGIMAMYSGEADEKGNTFEVCPQNIGPKLWLWSPTRDITLEDIEPLGPGETFLFKPIGVISDMDLDTFFSTYKDPDTPTCIDVVGE